MKSLLRCCTSLTFKTIESAKFFIENLASAQEISKLSIVVGLQEDHYPSEEQMFFALGQVSASLTYTFALSSFEERTISPVKLAAW